MTDDATPDTPEEPAAPADSGPELVEFIATTNDTVQIGGMGDGTTPASVATLVLVKDQPILLNRDQARVLRDSGAVKPKELGFDS